jgi:hypothetical protein
MASRDIAPVRRRATIRITDEIAIHQTEIEERLVRVPRGHRTQSANRDAARERLG